MLIALVERYVKVVVERKLDGTASKMIEGNRKGDREKSQWQST
jgi:hypothetical protein